MTAIPPADDGIANGDKQQQYDQLFQRLNTLCGIDGRDETDTIALIASIACALKQALTANGTRYRFWQRRGIAAQVDHKNSTLIMMSNCHVKPSRVSGIRPIFNNTAPLSD